jgi:hypothetical protein
MNRNECRAPGIETEFANSHRSKEVLDKNRRYKSLTACREKLSPQVVSLTRCKFPRNGNYSITCLALAGRWYEPPGPLTVPTPADAGSTREVPQGRRTMTTSDSQPTPPEPSTTNTPELLPQPEALQDTSALVVPVAESTVDPSDIPPPLPESARKRDDQRAPALPALPP